MRRAGGTRGLAVGLVIAAVLAPVPSTVAGQTSPDRGDLPSRSLAPPFFWVDTTQFLDQDGAPGVRVTFSIPYNQLHFVRGEGSGYRAAFDVSEIIYDRKQRQVTGDVWRHHVEVDAYGATRSRRQRFTDTQEFSVAPGEYDLVVRFRSYDTSTASRVTRRLRIEEVDREALSLSGLEIGTCADSLGRAVEASAAGFEVSLERRFGDPLPPVCARVDLFDAVAEEAPRDVRLTLRVLDAEGRERQRAGYVVQARQRRTEIAVDVPVLALQPGTYTVELTAEREGTSNSARREFEIDASRIDLDSHFADLVELAGVFLDEDVERALGDVPVAERRTAWQAFWKERDPDPGTERNELLEEFLARIRTAGSRFGGRGQAGWATDRGRVYVRHGEPDDIENVPRGFDAPAYEIWRYTERGLRFVFVDSTGFGEYKLIERTEQSF